MSPFHESGGCSAARTNSVSTVIAMRPLTAIAILALFSFCADAQSHAPPGGGGGVSRALFSLLGINDEYPFENILNCSQALGVSKCLNALSVWRAENAFNAFTKEPGANFNLAADVERFPWKDYTNNTDNQLYSQLCDGTEKLLQYRSLTMTMIPGYSLELVSKGNGTLNVDVFKRNETESGRSSMKKFQKQFYAIVPYLLVPGLIMSAILPFVLPALKMMTVAVGMLNNMALSGAIFTLLRNNAFNDHYEKKVVYYNAGYKNEKHSQAYYKESYINDDNFEDDHYGESAPYETSYDDGHIAEEDFYNSQKYPSDTDWINQYYGGDQMKVFKHNSKRNVKRKRRNHLNRG